MIRVSTLTPRLTDQPCTFCIGSFDGVHRGHQHLLSIAKAVAHSRHTPLAVLTFSNTPRAFLNQKSHSLITTPLHKARQLERLGVDMLLDISFTKELSLLPPEIFVVLLEKSLPIACWVVGEDIRFGRQQTGTLRFLQDYARKALQEVRVVGKIEDEGTVISSTRIREAIRKGDIEVASTLLGRPYSILSRVHEGVLDVEGLCLPPSRVWAVSVKEDGQAHEARLSITEQGCFLTPVHRGPHDVYPFQLENRLYIQANALFDSAIEKGPVSRIQRTFLDHRIKEAFTCSKGDSPTEMGIVEIELSNNIS